MYYLVHLRCDGDTTQRWHAREANVHYCVERDWRRRDMDRKRSVEYPGLKQSVVRRVHTDRNDTIVTDPCGLDEPVVSGLAVI